MISIRAKNILTAAIREFIESGQPVSSVQLFEKYDFGIKPAMIRSELQQLDDRGYLSQPHHSAGRVPTDRGYEFFAESALRRDETAPLGAEISRLFREADWPDLLEWLSAELGLLGVASEPAGGVYKEGLLNLVENMDWDSRADLGAVIRDFEAIDGRIEEAKNMAWGAEGIRIFIGPKSPVTRSEELAVVAGRYDFRGGTFLFAIGPKRMDYENAAKVFKGLKKIPKK